MSGHHSFNCDGFLIALHCSLSIRRFYERAGNIVNEIGLGICAWCFGLGVLGLGSWEFNQSHKDQRTKGQRAKPRNNFPVTLLESSVMMVSAVGPVVLNIPVRCPCIKDALLTNPIMTCRFTNKIRRVGWLPFLCSSLAICCEYFCASSGCEPVTSSRSPPGIAGPGNDATALWLAGSADRNSRRHSRLGASRERTVQSRVQHETRHCPGCVANVWSRSPLCDRRLD